MAENLYILCFLFVLALNVEFLLLLSPETHLRSSDKNLRLRKEIYDFLFADILLCSRKMREREKEREREREKERERKREQERKKMRERDRESKREKK